MDEEIKKCAALLLEGKVILYPTDTVWGIGCDATNAKAISRIYEIKKRSERKSMIILIDKSDKLPLYVKKIPLIAWDLISHIYRPTTFIYPSACNLPQQLVPVDGTIAIRIINDNIFCKKLISAIDRPITSTSANISQQGAPVSFSDISQEIIDQVDYVVPPEYAESTDYKPSRLIKFIDDYNFTVVRE